MGRLLQEEPSVLQAHLGAWVVDGIERLHQLRLCRLHRPGRHGLQTATQLALSGAQQVQQQAHLAGCTAGWR